MNVLLKAQNVLNSVKLKLLLPYFFLRSYINFSVKTFKVISKEKFKVHKEQLFDKGQIIQMSVKSKELENSQKTSKLCRLKTSGHLLNTY